MDQPANDSARIARRHRLHAIAAAILLCASASVSAAMSPYEPDANRGQRLYQRYCEVCHTPNIHSRPNKLPLTRDELRGLVDHFRRTENLGWTPEEIEDVVDYLDRTRYHFTPGR